ncbi:MAG TPA: glutathione S-transferase family protein [Stellaceae bacterium]|nr:glutathione S-transferase family protein [Stellaceae bacterium]
MARPIVYGPAGSTYVWSARLALAEKGVAHDLVDVGLRDMRAPEHLARHPFGKIPAFEHDGFSLYETQAIMRYVDEAFPSAPLQPIDLHQFSRMNQIVGIVDAYAWRAIAAGICFPRIIAPLLGLPTDEAQIAKSIPQAKPCLSEIERIAGDDEFLAGDRVSLADLMVAPIVWYLGKTPEGPALLEPHAKLRAWMGRIADRQSFQVTKPPTA